MSTPEQDPDKYARECVAIEPMLLNEEFVRLPADIAYWNAKFADKLREYLIADMDYDEARAKALMIHREKLIASGGKATVADIEAAVDLDPLVRDARLGRIEAEVGKQQARGMVDALNAKREALVSLGAQLRKEMDNDPVIRSQHANFHRT